MTFLTLFSDDHGWAASDQRVYDAVDIPALTAVVEQTRLLSAAIDKQQLDAQQALEIARSQGYAEGLAQGLSEQRESLLKTATELREQHARTVAELQTTCVTIALDVVRKVAGEVATGEWLHAQAEHAARSLIDAPRLTLRVHPDELEAVLHAIGASEPSAIDRVVPDLALSAGECLLDTGSGTIDVSLDTQLASIARLFEAESAAVDQHG